MFVRTESSDLANKENVRIGVDSSFVTLGALTSGQSGYGTFTVDIPSGYKTTGFVNVKKLHSGVGHAYNVMAAIGGNKTGQATGDYSYQSVGSVAANASDFLVLVECVKV